MDKARILCGICPGDSKCRYKAQVKDKKQKSENAKAHGVV
ncbi:hypothetical protein CGLAMM_04760 [Acetobacteraceae bacterium EV16G]|uniref:Uncharacterized protein n=1 Tax=Sorlinia euscelidii TaxID=3081148 RepID=A0ABU7U0E2_9PROT